jgi:8-oxo-dGTP pyrophosphatase MutT (NUDIX family)
MAENDRTGGNEPHARDISKISKALSMEEKLAALQDAPESPWRTLAAREMYRNPWLHVVEYAVRRPDGNPGIYGVVYPGDNASIVALDDEEHVYLVGAFLYPLQRYEWSIPSGKVEDDEEPLASAQRELAEEAGLTADRWDLLGAYYLTPGVSPQTSYIYLARNLRQGIPQPDETEALTLERRPLREVFAACQRNEIRNSVTVLGIWRAWTLLHGDGPHP